MQPTKTPYRVVPMDNKYGYQIQSGGEKRGTLRIVATCAAPEGGAGIKTMTPKAKANAEFIACACNAHAALTRLAERVAGLNSAAGEIGAGMLSSLIEDANEALRCAVPSTPLQN